MTVRVAYVTTNRSDYGAAYWLLHDLAHDPRFSLHLLVGGAHLSASQTVSEIETDGFEIAARVPFDDDPIGAAAGALSGFAQALRTIDPDVVVVYGDRWELLPIATAAVLTGIPLAHLCGGDVTEGAIDDSVRHSVTKLAHIHFATSGRSARRIRQMGEEAWRVHDVGDPSLDRFRRGRAASVDELERFLGFRPDRETLLVTFHPPTLSTSVRGDATALANALEAYRGHVVITAPAPDPGAEIVREIIDELVRKRPQTVFIESLGSERYRGLMAIAGAMVGNSSSGLSEAPCVALPAVNIGDRQRGRDRAANVIDVPANADAIREAILRAISPEFRASLAGLTSPYGDGQSAARIVSVLAALPERATLLRKRFVDIEPTETATSRGKPIGGDFALDASWLFQSSSWYATGRDALAAIALQRPGRWLLPAYLCRVVGETFQIAGCTVEPYSWHTPWTVDSESLAGRLAGAAGIVVPFHLGYAPDEAIWRTLAGTTACVVEDRCQWVGLPPAQSTLRGDFAIGSFRKWLATPDGAWCVSRAGTAPTALGQPARAMVELRVAAGLAKAAWLAGGAQDAALERAGVSLFARGEAAAGDARADRTASGIVDRVLARVDVTAIAAQRVSNQRALATRLTRSRRVRVWEPARGIFATSDVPLLALPVLCDDRDQLRAELADQRIFCAVHWPDGDWSRTNGLAAEWSARALSLPIDQRLGPEDMERIARAID